MTTNLFYLWRWSHWGRCLENDLRCLYVEAHTHFLPLPLLLSRPPPLRPSGVIRDLRPGRQWSKQVSWDLFCQDSPNWSPRVEACIPRTFKICWGILAYLKLSDLKLVWEAVPWSYRSPPVKQNVIQISTGLSAATSWCG